MATTRKEVWKDGKERLVTRDDKGKFVTWRYVVKEKKEVVLREAVPETMCRLTLAINYWVHSTPTDPNYWAYSVTVYGDYDYVQSKKEQLKEELKERVKDAVGGYPPSEWWFPSEPHESLDYVLFDPHKYGKIEWDNYRV